MQVKLSDYDGSGCDIVKLPFGNGVGLSPGVIVGASCSTCGPCYLFFKIPNLLSMTCL